MSRLSAEQQEYARELATDLRGMVGDTRERAFRLAGDGEQPLCSRQRRALGRLMASGAAEDTVWEVLAGW
jgi:hypothetical protein